MTTEAALARVVEALEASGVPYMLVGSLSSNFESWCDRHGTRPLLDDVRRDVAESQA